MTIPAGRALLGHHLRSAQDHILRAKKCAEGLVSAPGADIDACYRTRAELRAMADTLNDFIGDWGAV